MSKSIQQDITFSPPLRIYFATFLDTVLTGSLKKKTATLQK